MKLLRPKDRILLALGIMGDIWDEYRLVGGLVTKKYEDLYGWVPPAYKRNNFYQTIYRSLTTGDLEKIVVNGEPCFRLTSTSGKKLIRDFPIFSLQTRPWRKIWTVGVFDIEEVVRWQREWARELFVGLGFGRLQKSVYISPYELGEDLAEMIAAKRLGEKIKIFTKANLAGGYEKELALKVWPIEELNEKYHRVVSECLSISKFFAKERQEEVKKVRAFYLNLLIKDPHLPFELLPSDWVGRKARKFVKSLR
jgi:phenylacetic acid degradation operon negative regulatory protein